MSESSEPVTGPRVKPAPLSLPSVVQVSRPFFTMNELSYLHSLTIAENKKIAYSQKKHQIFQFIFQIVKHMKFPLRILNSAMNYYQRFYLFNKFEDVDYNNMEQDPFMVATTCLFLAAKNEDCIKKLRDILVVANKIRDIEQESNNNSSNNTPTSNLLDRQKKCIMNLEFKLLQIIKFDFLSGSNSIPSIDQLVVQFSKKLNIDYKSTMFSWLVSFDIMSTPLCLIIPPHCIALAIVIVTLNLQPNDLITKYHKSDNQEVQEYETKLDDILEKIDTYRDFKCPEPLVNEGIIYLLNYYIHQMNFSILNEFLPLINEKSGKEQIFKIMDFKSRFNDLQTLSEKSTANDSLLRQDEYLKTWDYSIGAKGSVRFMLGNKRRRFDKELDIISKKP